MDHTMLTRCLINTHDCPDFKSPLAVSQAGRYGMSTSEATAKGWRENDVVEPAVTSVYHAPDIPAATDKSAVAPAPENEVDAGASAEVEVIRQADLRRAELLGSVSHELRSPLTVIKGYAATLLRHEQSLDQAERREFLAAIGQACDRLEVTVNQLLEMSQLESGMLVPRFMRMDIVQVVREAVTGVTGRLATSGSGERRLSVQVLGAKALPLVQADPRLLRDALDSVLENALQEAPAGGSILIGLQEAALPEIAVSGGAGTLAVGTALARAVVISVQDAGIDIPAEPQPRVVARFHRVDGGLTRDVNGLGLAIVARIVGLHGGVVWGESWLGEGSAFFLALPAAPDDDEEDGESRADDRLT
jgi:signal transduction histidine kinase